MGRKKSITDSNSEHEAIKELHSIQVFDDERWRNFPLTLPDWADVEERAAIYEFDAGMDAKEARKRAYWEFQEARERERRLPKRSG